MKTKHLSRAGGADVNLTIHLTPDQLRVLRLLEEGLRSKEIAEKTGLKTSAISRIRSHLLSVFNVKTTTALIKAAKEAGAMAVRDPQRSVPTWGGGGKATSNGHESTWAETWRSRTAQCSAPSALESGHAHPAAPDAGIVNIASARHDVTSNAHPDQGGTQRACGNRVQNALVGRSAAL